MISLASAIIDQTFFVCSSGFVIYSSYSEWIIFSSFNDNSDTWDNLLFFKRATFLLSFKFFIIFFIIFFLLFFLSLLKKTENVFEEADCLNQAIKGKGAGPLFNLSGSNSRNGVKLGKHAQRLLWNPEPAKLEAGS